MNKLTLTLALVIFGLFAFQKQESSAMIASWSHFKRAMKDHDFERSASFFDFPITDDENDIWLVAKNFPKDDDTLIGEGTRDFTIRDLKTYYDFIFPLEFRNYVNKIDIQDLDKVDTIRFETVIQLDTTYNFKATLSTNKSQLDLIYERNIPGDKQEVLYEMNLDPDQRLKIVRIEVAD